MLSVSNPQGNANQNHNELSPFGMTVIQKARDNKVGRKAHHCTLLMGMCIGIAIMGNGYEVPQKIKNGKLKIKNGMCDPAILFYKYISRENDINIWKKYLYSCSL